MKNNVESRASEDAMWDKISYAGSEDNLGFITNTEDEYRPGPLGSTKHLQPHRWRWLIMTEKHSVHSDTTPVLDTANRHNLV